MKLLIEGGEKLGIGKAQGRAFSTQDFEVLRSLEDLHIELREESGCVLVGTGSLCYIYPDQNFPVVQGSSCVQRPVSIAPCIEGY